MFNNYKELFISCLDFYKASLYEFSTAGNQTATSISLNRDQSSEIWPVQSITFETNENGSAPGNEFDSAPTVNGSSNPLALLSRLSFGASAAEAATIKSGHVLRKTQKDLLINDPLLMLERGGTRLVRIGSFNGLEAADIAHIVAILIAFVYAKRLLSYKLAKLKQIDQLGLRPKDRERLNEITWRLFYYSFSSSWLIYACFKNSSQLLLTTGPSEPLSYQFQMDWATYAILMIETAFYLHATYALLFEDVWRRDSLMMLVHHLAAIFSVLGIYTARLHQIGIVSMVLRDTCDVLLEVTKLTKCFHIQHGRHVQSLGIAIRCFLTIFAFAFAVNQLYYFPLFCLFHGLNMTKLYNIQSGVVVGILSCGLLFLLLDLVWFVMILRLLYYMALAKPLKDLRDYDDEDDDIVQSNGEAETKKDKKD